MRILFISSLLIQIHNVYLKDDSILTAYFASAFLSLSLPLSEEKGGKVACPFSVTYACCYR